MSFYPCRAGGGNLKPFTIRLMASSGSVNTGGAITAHAALPFYMVKRIELYSLEGENNDGNISLTVKGCPESFASETEIEKKTAKRVDISTTNPLFIDLSNSEKYDYIQMELSGTNWNYVQIGRLKIYPR